MFVNAHQYLIALEQKGHDVVMRFVEVNEEIRYWRRQKSKCCEVIKKIKQEKLIYFIVSM